MFKKVFILGVNILGFKYFENDVCLISKCLEVYGYEIWNFKLSKFELMSEFWDFIVGLIEIDIFIFYFFGYGYIQNGELLFLFNEGNLNNIKNQFWIGDIIKGFENCQVVNKFIILDCCNVGVAVDNWNFKQFENYFIMIVSECL